MNSPLDASEVRIEIYEYPVRTPPSPKVRFTNKYELSFPQRRWERGGLCRKGGKTETRKRRSGECVTWNAGGDKNGFSPSEELSPPVASRIFTDGQRKEESGEKAKIFDWGILRKKKTKKCLNFTVDGKKLFAKAARISNPFSQQKKKEEKTKQNQTNWMLRSKTNLTKASKVASA